MHTRPRRAHDEIIEELRQARNSIRPHPLVVLRRPLNLALLTDMSCNVRVTLLPMTTGQPGPNEGAACAGVYNVF